MDLPVKTAGLKVPKEVNEGLKKGVKALTAGGAAVGGAAGAASGALNSEKGHRIEGAAKGGVAGAALGGVAGHHGGVAAAKEVRKGVKEGIGKVMRGEIKLASSEDLPEQALLQQAHARPISGEELEVLGKKAGALYLSGDCSSLTDAVVETVKHAGLSPEQVRRVVEFANVGTYIDQFKTASAGHKYVEFHGGPADPSEVLKDLNDGGGGTVFDRGSADYGQPPPMLQKAAHVSQDSGEREKAASAPMPDPFEAAFEQMWQAEDKPLPFANPYADSEDLREKLAGARDHLTSDLSFLETEFMAVSEDLYQQVKQAALEGTPLGHVIQAWGEATPGEGYVKAAFSEIGPRLAREGVMSLDEIGGSLSKTAGARAMANHDHPLIKCFAAYCTQLEKVAGTRMARDEIVEAYERIDRFVKEAGKEGLVPKAYRGAKELSRAASGPVGENVGKATHMLFGADAAKKVGPLAGKAIEYAPEAAALIGAKTVYDHLKYQPAFQKAKYVALSQIPGTMEHQNREYMLQQGM